MHKGCSGGQVSSVAETPKPSLSSGETVKPPRRLEGFLVRLLCLDGKESLARLVEDFLDHARTCTRCHSGLIYFLRSILGRGRRVSRG